MLDLKSMSDNRVRHDLNEIRFIICFDVAIQLTKYIKAMLGLCGGSVVDDGPAINPTLAQFIVLAGLFNMANIYIDMMIKCV